MPTLDADQISVSFGPLKALDNVSVTFEAGEIHAILGENGAGKSTLMNVLAGFLVADRGGISLSDQPLPAGDPIRVREMGIQMVHQHFMLVPEFSIEENLALSRLGSLRGSLDIADLTTPHRTLAAELGWPLSFQGRTANAAVGIQQRAEILKALTGNSKVIILDEPTAVLSPAETEDLFRILRDQRDRGKTIILIAHKLREIISVADRATVLRKGKVVATTKISDTTVQQLANWMVGEAKSSSVVPSASLGERLVNLDSICAKGDRGELAVDGISLQVRAGEIVAIGGVDGNGQIELAEALVGIRGITSGTRSIPARIGYIPQDRQSDGLALELGLEDNFLIAGYRDAELRNGPLLRRRLIREWATKLVQSYKIKVQNLGDQASSLSGGNQQKIVVSREIGNRPELLVAVNPTRGLDFNATSFVLDSIRQAASAGAAVVLISTDADEIEAIADRTMYISAGKLIEGTLNSTLAGESGA